jgi:hypothetical protein
VPKITYRNKKKKREIYKTIKNLFTENNEINPIYTLECDDVVRN